MRPTICASLTNVESVDKANEADIVEVRIDLLGSEWVKVVDRLRRPWIACNRRVDEGGRWLGCESGRINELLSAVELGASIVDLELSTENVVDVVREFRKLGVTVIVSKHILTHTPTADELRALVNKIISVGADVWKVVTKANSISDNLVMLNLLKEFRGPGISLAMGELGVISRIISPLVGGFLTYVSTGRGLESAPGQLTIDEAKAIYRMLGVIP